MTRRTPIKLSQIDGKLSPGCLPAVHNPAHLVAGHVRAKTIDLALAVESNDGQANVQLDGGCLVLYDVLMYGRAIESRVGVLSIDSEQLSHKSAGNGGEAMDILE